MKFLGVIVALCLTMGVAACGGGDSSSKANDSSAEGPKTEQLYPFEPDIDPPKRLPKKLIVIDIKEGSGPPIEPGDELTLDYFSVNEKDETQFSSRTIDFEVEYGTGDYWPGWERGLAGMKVGGRREILMPARLTTNLGYLFYIIDLLKVEKPKDTPEGESEATNGSEP